MAKKKKENEKGKPEKITFIVNGQQMEVPMDGKTEFKVTLPVQSDPDPAPEPESFWESLVVILECIGGILRILPVLIIQLILFFIILWAIISSFF